MKTTLIQLSNDISIIFQLKILLKILPFKVRLVMCLTGRHYGMKNFLDWLHRN